MAVKNISASVLARLRNQAIQENLNYQLCLQLFVQEEFLRRLSRSPYGAITQYYEILWKSNILRNIPASQERL